MDSSQALLQWMLGTVNINYHDLQLMMSYDSCSLVLAEDNNTGEAFFFFDDRSGQRFRYTGNYMSFPTLAKAREYYTHVADDVEWDDFSILIHFFKAIESTEDL